MTGLALAFLIACGGSGLTGPVQSTSPVTVKVTPEAAELSPDGSTQFSAFVSGDAQEEAGPIRWSVTDSSIVQVDDTGHVKASERGTAFVVAFTESGIRDSAEVTVTDASGSTPAPGSDDDSNEPAGFALVTEHLFDDREGSGWGTMDDNFSIQRDDAAPRSPSNVGQMHYRAGHRGGTAPGNTWRTFSGRSEVYLRYWLKLSPSFTNHHVGTKVLFITARDVSGGGNPVFTFLNGGSSFRYEVRLQGSNEGARNLASNLGLPRDASLSPGQWHKIETLLIGNTPGSNDGEVHVWIDGMKTHEYEDVGFFPATSSGKFDVVKWNPHYGGMGGSAPHDQYMWMDHLYISGRD